MEGGSTDAQMLQQMNAEIDSKLAQIDSFNNEINHRLLLPAVPANWQSINGLLSEVNNNLQRVTEILTLLPGSPLDPTEAQMVNERLAQIQSILAQNDLLINEIIRIVHFSRPENSGRNVGVITDELNSNFEQVAEIYNSMPGCLTTFGEPSLGDGSSTKRKISGLELGGQNQKRQRPSG